jgi:HEPN domain-containing protein
MNRSDFQQIAQLRLDEAQLLFAAGRFSGAYYLAGYAVECALKACIARATQAYDFPEKTRVNDSYTHDLVKLLKTAELQAALQDVRLANPGLGKRWDTAQEWSESSRYSIWQQADAELMLDAVTHPAEGVFAWLVQHW